MLEACTPRCTPCRASRAGSYGVRRPLWMSRKWGSPFSAEWSWLSRVSSRVALEDGSGTRPQRRRYSSASSSGIFRKTLERLPLFPICEERLCSVSHLISPTSHFCPRIIGDAVYSTVTNLTDCYPGHVKKGPMLDRTDTAPEIVDGEAGLSIRDGRGWLSGRGDRQLSAGLKAAGYRSSKS
jgi:hypothetical protein